MDKDSTSQVVGSPLVPSSSPSPLKMVWEVFWFVWSHATTSNILTNTKNRSRGSFAKSARADVTNMPYIGWAGSLVVMKINKNNTQVKRCSAIACQHACWLASNAADFVYFYMLLATISTGQVVSWERVLCYSIYSSINNSSMLQKITTCESQSRRTERFSTVLFYLARTIAIEKNKKIHCNY